MFSLARLCWSAQCRNALDTGNQHLDEPGFICLIAAQISGLGLSPICMQGERMCSFHNESPNIPFGHGSRDVSRELSLVYI